MTLFATYNTITLTNASAAVTVGSGALTTDGVQAGDLLVVIVSGAYVTLPILSVESDTALTLDAAWGGSTGGSLTGFFVPLNGSALAAETLRLVNAYVRDLNDGTFVAASITAATAKTTPVDADTIGIADSAASFALKKLTFANLATWVGTKLGPLIAVITGKTTIVDADSIVISDSEASAASKQLTFTNLWAWANAKVAAAYAAKTGTPANNRIAVWTDANTIEGSTTLSWDELLLLLQVAGATTGLRLTTSGGTVDWSMSGATSFWTNYHGAMAFTAAAGDITFTASAGEVIMGSPCVMKSYTVATVPSASASGAGAEIYVTDETGGATLAFSDGTNWRRVQDRAVIS